MFLISVPDVIPEFKFSLLAQSQPLPPQSGFATLPITSASILIAVAVAIGVGVGFYQLRNAIVALLQRNDTFRACCYVGEPLLSAAFGIIVVAAGLWKPETWQNQSPLLLTFLPLAVGLILSTVAIKVLAAWSKEKEKHKIVGLEEMVAQSSAAVASLKSREATSIKMAYQIRSVVEEKMERLRAATRNSGFCAEEYVLALSAREQLQFIIIMIHQFFQHQLTSGKSLRAGVYLVSPPNSNQLTAVYSWDGKGRVNFHPGSARFMRLDDPEANSMMVQAFRSDKVLLTITSCEGASREGSFTYFRPEQRRYLKSILTYKHIWDRDADDGIKDALILTLDTDQDGFFGQFPEDQMREFLIDMMMRFEYELIGLEAQEMLEEPRLKKPTE